MSLFDIFKNTITVYLCTQCRREVNQRWRYCPSCGNRLNWEAEE